MDHETHKRRRGRPPGGGHGQRVRDFPTLLVRLPPKVRQILAAIVETSGRPNWKVMSDMVLLHHQNYLKNYEPGMYKRVEALLAEANEHDF